MKAIKQFYIISLSIFTLVVSHAQQPVAHWTFDNQNAEDVSGNGFHGTLTNVKFNKGINCDTAVWFTGISSYVNFGDILDTLFTKGTFSISMWAYPQARVDDNGYTGFLMQKWFTSSSSNNAFILRLFRFDGNNKAMSFHPLDLNVWSHIAVSVDNGNASIYINGQMVAQDSGFVFNASSQPLRLGNLHNNHYEYTGGIDDVRIYNEALSVQQINDLIKLNGFYDQYTTDIILEAGNELIIGPERRAGFNYSWNTGSNESQINIHSATADTTTFSLEIEDLENCTVQDTIKVIWYELENHKLARWTFNDSLELEATAAINGAIVDTGIMCSNSFYFDGDDAYISLGDTLGTYFSGIEDISISLWVNLMDTIDPDGYPAMILSKWKTSGSTIDNSFLLYYNHLKFADGKIIEFGTPEMQKWIHYAIIRKDNVTSVYIDNKMVGSCVYCNVKPSTYPLMVGAHHNNFYNLKGNVDELKVYDLAISKETLKKLSREAYVQPLNKLTDQTVAPEGTITLDAGSGFDSYIWSDGKNQQMNTLSNINSDITDLSVLAINEDGCYSDTISIFVSTSSVSHNDFKPEIKMWPCPVQNELYISFDQVPASKIEVYNLGGQLVFASVDLHATNVFSLKNLDNGPFVIKFYFDDIVVSEKIIKY